MIISSPKTIALLASRANSGLMPAAVAAATSGFENFFPGVRCISALRARGFKEVVDESGFIAALIDEDRGITILWAVAVRASALLPDWYHSLFDAICIEEGGDSESPWDDFDEVVPPRGAWAH